jgi:hypothetical protein
MSRFARENLSFDQTCHSFLVSSIRGDAVSVTADSSIFEQLWISIYRLGGTRHAAHTMFLLTVLLTTFTLFSRGPFFEKREPRFCPFLKSAPTP